MSHRRLRVTTSNANTGVKKINKKIKTMLCKAIHFFPSWDYRSYVESHSKILMLFSEYLFHFNNVTDG